MNLPFTSEQFLEVFRQYNQSIFPMLVVFYFLGLVCIYYLFGSRKYSGRLISAILGFFWLWNGLFYHIINFSRINTAAYGFGIIFIIQGLLILYYGVIRKKLIFEFRTDYRSITGIILITYAMVIYSLIGYTAGHLYPYSPVFGAAPCPTTIFTFGILVQQREKMSPAVIIIPLIWSLIGFSATFKLGITEDIGLLVSGIISLAILLASTRKRVNAVHSN